MILEKNRIKIYECINYNTLKKCLKNARPLKVQSINGYRPDIS